MAKTSAKYRFERISNSLAGFGSKNRPSTDAIGALQRWRAINIERSFTILVDEDEFIEAELTWDDADTSAGALLDDFCFKKGVERRHLG